MDRLFFKTVAISAAVSGLGFAVLHWIDSRLTAFANLTHDE
jgi:hypothetical protein